MSDLLATINQSSVDKIVGSVSYPLTVFDHSWPFSGTNFAAKRYSTKQATDLLERAVKKGSIGNSVPEDAESQFLSELLSNATEIMEQQKQLLQDTSIPDSHRKKVQEAVDSGVVGLAKLGFLQPHLAWLQVVLRQKPTIAIASPQTSMPNVKVAVGATGELWIQYWWFGWKWARIASITITGVNVVADAHADFKAVGTSVQAYGVFDKLRLDYDILRDIPLEGLANDIVGNDPLAVYDASKLIATVPILESHFSVSAIILPTSKGNITVGVTVKQVK